MLVMLNEIRAALSRKTFLILALGMPLLLGVIAAIAMAVNRGGPPMAADTAKAGLDAAEEMTKGFVDQGGLIEGLPADVPPGQLARYPDQAAAQAALEAEEIMGYYVIPADHVESGDILYVTGQHNPVSDKLESEGIEWVLLYNLLGDAERAAEVWEPLEVTVRALKPAEAQAEDSWIVELFPTLMVLILYMVVLIPSGMLVNAVTDEKKNRVMEVLISSLSPIQMIAGKILALGLLGFLQTALWIGVSWAVVSYGGRPLNIPVGFSVPGQLVLWSFVYGLLGYVMYGAQMAGLGALVPDLKDARGTSFVIMIPMIAVYSFAFGIYEAPNGPFALVMSLFPLTSPVGMIARMTQVTVPLWQASLAAVLQLFAAILIVRLVARLFRAQHLLCGQPFSTKQYFRALLGGG
jgi:ABC-2 type transport system permease protein